MSEAHVIFSWTHDSVGLGEDGPTHQPIEHLASLRAMPFLRLIRPADANETAAALPHRDRRRRRDRRWSSAGRTCRCSTAPPTATTTSPAAPTCCATPTASPTSCSSAPAARCRCASTPPTLLAADGVGARVVSMPCWDLFEVQDEDVPGRRAARPTCRSSPSRRGSSFGWDRWADDSVSIDRFGASAPGDGRAREARLHRPSNVARRARSRSSRSWKRTDHDEAARPVREHGQSPWLDNLSRDCDPRRHAAGLARPGRPRRHVEPVDLPEGDDGGRTRTTRSSSRSCSGGASTEDAYWTMVIDDIQDARSACCGRCSTRAAATTASCRSRSHPPLARDTAATIARRAAGSTTRSPQPNLMVKIPATAEGVPAIRDVIAAGRNVNVTLIFGLDRYADVMDAYIAGLETLAATGADISKVRSVGSFFVSRVDTEVDRRLEAIGTPRRHSRCGARPPSRRRSSPTDRSRRRSAAHAGRRSRPRAQPCSVRCGRRRRRRTPPIPTRSTSTR